MKIMIMTQIIFISMMWMIMYMVIFKKKSNSMTMNPFECGFNTMMNKLPLKIQFTLIVFIFLLFDIELSILISAMWKIKTLNSNWIMTITWFTMALMISLMYELLKKIISWTKK